MEWRDDGIVLSLRRHGESRTIVELLTRTHGRHMGLVRGRSGKHGNALQPGTSVTAVWRARLDDHLGTYALEPVRARAGLITGSGAGLLGFSAAAALLGQALPEREAHGSLFEAFELLADHLEDDDVWPALYVRFELGLLAELGFGLDLDRCAVTGAREDLTHVSPRSGKAVSAAEAEPYLDRLLLLPGFLVGSGGASGDEVLQGLALTGHFLEQRLWQPQAKTAPDARERLVRRLRRAQT